jgi:hypothetical protein
MKAVAAGLYVLAYLSAVVDGSRQQTGNWPEGDTGRVGLPRYASEHRWIVFGALSGVAATVVLFLAG